MKTLTVTLKQHTPLIHFQHDQYGATLRASEVKPKLDKFILVKFGNGIYADGTKKAKANGWLIGEHSALDYKLKIVSKERISNLHLRNIEKEKKKWSTEDFPLLLANMGGRDAVDELMNFSMYGNVVMYLICRNDDLYNELMKQLPYFIVNTNFGQRSNKGFGSFTIEYIEDFTGVKKKINSRGYNPSYIAEDTLYMDFCLKKNVDDDEEICSLERQKVIFKVIENYWNRLRNSINKDTSINCIMIDSVEAYIKGMKFIEQDEENVQRLPAPIIFKPISYIDEDNLNVAIYIMLDSVFIERLEHQYGHSSKITKMNVLLADKMNDLSYIDDFSENMLHPKFKNLRMRIENEMIDIEFYGQ